MYFTTKNILKRFLCLLQKTRVSYNTMPVSPKVVSKRSSLAYNKR